MATLILARNGALPDAVSTHPIKRLRDWLQGSWAVLYSNPEDFAPHPSTPQGFISYLSNEFAQCNVKPIALAHDVRVPRANWLEQAGTDNCVVIVDADVADAPVVDLAECALAMKLARTSGPFVMVLDANGCCRSTVRYRPPHLSRHPNRHLDRRSTMADILNVIDVLRSRTPVTATAGKKSA